MSLTHSPNSIARRMLHASIVTMLVSACSVSTDEQQVRAVIAAAETAAEARNTSDVLALVAEDYIDGQGFDKPQLKQFLRAYFLTHPKIEAAIHVSKIEFETANSARVRVEVVMVGTQRGGEMGSTLSGDAETLQIELRRQESRWRVTRVDRIAK